MAEILSGFSLSRSLISLSSITGITTSWQSSTSFQLIALWFLTVPWEIIAPVRSNQTQGSIIFEASFWGSECRKALNSLFSGSLWWISWPMLLLFKRSIQFLNWLLPELPLVLTVFLGLDSPKIGSKQSQFLWRDFQSLPPDLTFYFYFIFFHQT